MNKVATTIAKIRDRLSDSRYWVKGTLTHPDVPLMAEHDRRVCLLGAHLDVLTDEAARDWLMGGRRDSKWDGVLNELFINADPTNQLLTKVLIEQFPERVDSPEPWAAIPSFNDHSATTHEDLMLVLEKAQAEAEASIDFN
jgi:hypothetical protein